MIELSLLEAAEGIGRDIIASAVWHGDRCSWVGAMPEEGPGGRPVLCFAALGADLYGGTAGVGLFLAELASTTGDTDARRTAAGALRHAASRAADLPAPARAGLYAGRAGVAVALALGALALDDDELRSRAQTLTGELASESSTDEFDLMSGHAGAIVGLLALRTLVEHDGLLEAAIAHAEALVSGADRIDDMACWRSPSFGDVPGLTGLSHGAAGVALALLELGAVTGSADYAETAAAAFRYERALFDAVAGNWPDLRAAPAGDGLPSTTTVGFSHFWCHGAPGGALARLRAAELATERATELGRDAVLLDEASAALRCTASWVRSALDAGHGNYSLCHGLAGSAEILLEGASRHDGGADLALEVAETGIESYAARGREWPTGVDGGTTPGLFLGTAGTGRFYLRLAVPELPSLLAVRPRAARRRDLSMTT